MGSSLVEAKLFGPLQENVAPVVVDPPSRWRSGSPQETVPPNAETVGGLVLPVTVAEAVEVQPLPGSVTVRAYNPAVLAMGFCVLELKLLGPDHTKVTPPVGEMPPSVMVGVLQPMTPPLAAAPGGVVLIGTVVVAVAEQLFAGLVMVTV